MLSLRSFDMTGFASKRLMVQDKIEGDMSTDSRKQLLEQLEEIVSQALELLETSEDLPDTADAIWNSIHTAWLAIDDELFDIESQKTATIECATR
jgi:hypothetical protein